MLKLKKATWLVNRIFPFISLEDTKEFVESLAENPEIKVDEWTAKEIAEMFMEVLEDM